MDSTEFNKIAGALIGAFLIFLLLNFLSGKVYGTGEGHHGPEVLAYAVEIEEADSGDGGAKPEVDLLALVASADPAAGEKVFNKCKSCHKIEDGANGVGPHLWGVVGRDIGSDAGYSYSDVLTSLPGDWTLESLSAFLEAPKKYAPGTKMSFNGLRDAEDRVNLIVYLNQADGTPVELQ